jgi:two-component system sensor kinase FixL
VLVNLLRNAVEAMKLAEDGAQGAHCLTVQTRVLPDGMIEIGVIDNGPGIAPELRDRLFQPFVTTKSKGMGMGLSVCRRLIEAHGGTIAVSAGPDGRGAAFRFTLPQFRSETEQSGG